MSSFISRSVEIMGGTVVFVGTRVPVATFIDYLEGGATIDQFLKDFPTVSREKAIGFLEETKNSLSAELRSAS